MKSRFYEYDPLTGKTREIFPSPEQQEKWRKNKSETWDEGRMEFKSVRKVREATAQKSPPSSTDANPSSTKNGDKA